MQDAETGWFLGPELRGWQPAAGAKHDLEHLSMHLTSAVLPVLTLYGTEPRYPLRAAHRFLDPALLRAWLARREWKDAWLEDLAPYDEVLLCFDNDRAGTQALDKVTRKIGFDRAKELRVPQLYNDVREAVKAGWEPKL
jgi:hypothetical protein